MKYVAIIVGLLLSSCVTASPWTNTPGDYTLHLRGEAELMKKYRELGGKKADVAGFAVYDREPCEIYIRIDQVNGVVLAHELRHCREKGSWHD